MERSLSVLLPVRDVQTTLAAAVLEILDILPELTSRFELIIIDDGSKDATLEVADDLASYYPQVRAIHHAEPRGHAAAIRTGLKHSSGEVIFLRDSSGELALDEVRKLWWAIDDHPLVLGRSTTPAAGRWLGWKRRGGVESLRMVDRRAIASIQKSLEEQAQLMASFARQEDPWFEVEIGRRRTHRSAVPGPLGKPRRATRAARHDRPSPLGNPPEKKPKGPKYLRKIKDFAVGE